MTSLDTVAEATVPSFIKAVPAGEVFVKLIVPAVAELTVNTPLRRERPAKMTLPAAAFTPAETLPAGSPTAEIPDIVKKYLDPVAVPAFAPVMDSVWESLFTSVTVTVKSSNPNQSALATKLNVIVDPSILDAISVPPVRV